MSQTSVDYQKIFENLPGLILILDPELVIVAVSNAYAKATLVRREDILGKNIFEVFPDNPEEVSASGVMNLRGSLNTVLETKQPQTMAVQKYDVRDPNASDGSFLEKYWSPCNSPIIDTDGHIKYIVHEVAEVTEYVKAKKVEGKQVQDLESRVDKMESDVYERAQEIQEANKKIKRANEELEIREKELRLLYDRLARVDRQKTQFFANVSHELRTPLTLIIGPTEKLLNDVRLQTTQRQQLTMIKKNAYTLLRHVNDLLDVAKIESGEIKARYARVDAVSLLRMTADNFMPMALDKHFKFLIQTPAHLWVDVDPDKLQRILMNLIGNAFKFTPGYGTIRCQAEEILNGKGSFLRITIADSGVGIPTQFRQSVFERFFQVQDSMNRQVGGTGLGLSIVKDFVDILHGSVEVRESLEGGAAFIVEIPMQAPAGAEIFEQDPNESSSLSVMKKDILEQAHSENSGSIGKTESKDLAELPLILVVEDNADLRGFIESSLAEHYRCATAADGAEGYRQARQLKPDLILTDLMMPVYSGEYLVEKLKSDPELKNIPVIILTAKVDEEMQLKLLGQGAADFIAKPFVTTELLLRLKNHVQSFRARQHLQGELNIKEDNIENLARDVTYKNQELVRLSRLKDEFLATLSHELRTPVSIIHGYAELLIDEIKEDGITKEAAEAIYRNAKSQLHLVADLVDISKSITGKIVLEPTAVNVKVTFDNLLETAINAGKAKRIHFTSEIDPQLKVLWADSVRLTQILWNLVSNSIKFTPPGGEIKISARKNGHDAEFAITDTGEGIEAGFLPYLFDRFSQQDGSITRKFGGLGLGLSIVKHLVDLHGGSIKVASDGLGKGATFTVTLPLGELSLSEESIRQVRKSEVLTIDLSGKTVLVVDDEADALSVISLILRKYGIKVLTAKSADEADAVLRDVIPDAIISDIGMPRRNGFEFIRDVRQSPTQVRDVPAIALTAFASKQSEQQALQAGFEMYVPKPIESKKLVSMLTALIQHGHLSTS